jgi:hypothetical protein
VPRRGNIFGVFFYWYSHKIIKHRREGGGIYHDFHPQSGGEGGLEGITPFLEKKNTGRGKGKLLSFPSSLEGDSPLFEKKKTLTFFHLERFLYCFLEFIIDQI